MGDQAREMIARIASMPIHAIGTLARSGEAGRYAVETEFGTFSSRRAASCLLEPEPGDEVLVSGPTLESAYIIAVLERPAADGPFGAKGPGEMCANPVLPAVANAIFNAVGVRIDDLPITPEKVLRAIKAQGGARPQARR